MRVSLLHMPWCTCLSACLLACLPCPPCLPARPPTSRPLPAHLPARLPESIKSICKIFADDTKIYNTTDNYNTLQQDLNSLTIWSEKWQLFFNSQKCKCLHHGKENTKHEYYIKTSNGREPLPDGEEEKDLGVYFSTNLNFDKHINESVRKANMTLGLIKRNFSYIDKDVFNKLYKSLVRPHLEYAQEVWQPYLKRQSKLIEGVQRRATKLIPELKNLNYEERLSHLKLPTLKYRRLRGDMILTFNLFNNGDNEVMGKLLKLHKGTNNIQTRGHNKKLIKDHFRLDIRKHSFSQRITNTWNSLPAYIVNATDTNTFKNLFDKFMFRHMSICDE